jgi:hypothetical protein
MVTVKQVEESQHYFGRLSDDCMNRLTILVEDSEKVDAASYAALALKSMKFTDEKIKSLREKFVYIQDEPCFGSSIKNVILMNSQYSHGKRDFGKETLMSANSVCCTFVGLTRTGEIKEAVKA